MLLLTLQVNEEVNFMFDSNEVISPNQRNSADCDVFSYDTILDLVEQLCRQSKARNTSWSLSVCYNDVNTHRSELPNRHGHISVLFM